MNVHPLSFKIRTSRELDGGSARWSSAPCRSASARIYTSEDLVILCRPTGESNGIYPGTYDHGRRFISAVIPVTCYLEFRALQYRGTRLGSKRLRDLEVAGRGRAWVSGRMWNGNVACSVFWIGRGYGEDGVLPLGGGGHGVHKAHGAARSWKMRTAVFVGREKGTIRRHLCDTSRGLELGLGLGMPGREDGVWGSFRGGGASYFLLGAKQDMGVVRAGGDGSECARDSPLVRCHARLRGEIDRPVSISWRVEVAERDLYSGPLAQAWKALSGGSRGEYSADDSLPEFQ
ncbi:hypothetical protein OE88DRAFT_1727851 [Heliocybe sulcata]|uniref:Uncharacterized protein n=1 Tax=Heliocybe sulcata TaxID=5364 RepID=A0A5C3MTS5_9AGAM|nr:hypothetical protein OE88DRAFT_1727851 [Heliocybe sulcata]